MTPSETVIRASQLAEALGVSVVSVRRWVRKGLIDVVQLPSGRYRFDPEVIATMRRPAHEGAKPRAT